MFSVPPKSCSFSPTALYVSSVLCVLSDKSQNDVFIAFLAMGALRSGVIWRTVIFLCIC